MRGQPVNTADSPIPLEEAELLEQCRQGDAAAFGRLVLKYQDRIFNTCWRLCGNQADAEDFTQEAFIRAFQSMGSFAGRSRFSTWLFRIAVNLVLSARRSKGRRMTQSLDAQSDRRSGDPLPSKANRLAAEDPSPEQHAAGREHERIVLQALNKLDDESRSVVVLRDVESFGYEEIAEILGIPTGTVKSRLHRARLALRGELSIMLDMA